MLVFPNAKINLGLYITSKRADGYHNLLTAFYPIGWQDALEIVPASKFQFTTSGISIAGHWQDNLCVKAYQLLAQVYELPPVHIHLHKHIPMGAGLGGGSSDAAFVLKMLNEMFQLQLSVAEQESYAKRLGSDCAFFIQNQPVLAVERGDCFLPLALPDLSQYFIWVVYPDIAISTAVAYSQVKPKTPDYVLEKALSQPIETWKECVQNDFEKPLFAQYPLLAKLKAQMYELGALYAAMSGSGSAIFGIFSNLPPDEGVLSAYKSWKGKL